MSNFGVMSSHYIFICSLLFVIAFGVSAQGQNTAYEGPTVIYSNQYYLGGNLATSGFGVHAYSGKYKGYNNLRLKSIEIIKLKHPKEYKLPNNGGENSRRFSYGKLSAFQAVRIGIGKKRLLSDKLRKGAMSVGYRYTFGPSIGFLKPIYVEINRVGGTEVNSIERYDPLAPTNHNFGNIVGKASFFEGIGETTIEPGIFISGALLFELSSDKDGVQQVEVGGSLDLFSRRIPIMANTENRQYFLSLFLSYSLGRKYIKR